MSPFREIAVLTPHSQNRQKCAFPLQALYGSIHSWTLFT